MLGRNGDESNEDEGESLPNLTLNGQISRFITCSTESINHVSFFALRHQLIAVGVDTKTISRSEGEARVQLGIWIAAHIQRIRALAGEHGLNHRSTVDPILAPDGLLLALHQRRLVDGLLRSPGSEQRWENYPDLHLQRPLSWEFIVSCRCLPNPLGPGNTANMGENCFRRVVARNPE